MNRRSMRADMSQEQVRAAGIYLNGGRRRGWKRRLSALIDTTEPTISAWSTRSAGNARPIPGVAAVAIKLLVAMMRQELMVTAHPDRAGDALSERLDALVHQPPPLAPDERPIRLGGGGRPSAAIQPTSWLGRQRPGQQVITPAEDVPADNAIPITIERAGRPGSSA
jgi:hypothetical protein